MFSRSLKYLILLAGGLGVATSAVELFQITRKNAVTPALTRAPSLQQCAADSAVLAWKTNIATPGLVQYGFDQSYNHETGNFTKTTFHVLALRRLQSDRVYNYRVVAGGQTLYAGAFRTYPQTGDSRYDHFSFWVLGDGGSGDRHQMAVRDQIQQVVNNGQADFGLYVGDIIYPKGAEADQDEKYFVPYKSIIDKQTCWTALGNHDQRAERGVAYYLNRALPVPDTLADPLHGNRWYAFSFGAALFIALDSSEPANPIQKRFLRRILKNSRDKLWKFVFFHQPPYATPYLNESPCSHASDMSARDNWSPLFEKYEVDVVFNGHNHTYQRSRLRRDYFPDKKGVYYFVSGGGGGQIDHHVEIKDSVCNHPPLTQAAVKSKTYHFVHVSIDGLTLSLRAIDETGQVFDTFTFTKSKPVPVADEDDKDEGAEPQKN